MNNGLFPNSNVHLSMHSALTSKVQEEFINEKLRSQIDPKEFLKCSYFNDPSFSPSEIPL